MGVTALVGVLTSVPATAESRRVVADPHVTDFVAKENASARLLARVRARRQTKPATPQAPPVDVPRVSTLDCLHASHSIQLDPRSGETRASLELDVRAEGGPLAKLGFLVDEGLVVSGATSHGRVVSLVQTITSPARSVELTLTPALAAGETARIEVAYEGTLACGSYPGGTGMVCATGRDFSYFAHQSVFPFLFDPEVASEKLDTMTRDLVVRVPAGTDVVATGEKVSESVDQAFSTTRWSIDKPLSRTLGLYLLAGKLGQMPIARDVPTTFVHPMPVGPIDEKWAGWSKPALDFVEQTGGAALPFRRSLSLVHLPSEFGDPGTATFGMTLLSDAYVRAGDIVHEETWAHENSHLFWGIVVPETDSLESRMLSEGLATLTEIDYTFTRHYATSDRDRYLARRFRPIGLDLRAHGGELPAVMLSAGEILPTDFRTTLYTLWAYYKTSATLDHLRATVGDAVFAKGLAQYVQRCSYVGCGIAEFREVIEDVSGQNLKPFFDRWVSGSSRPALAIGFEPSDRGAVVSLSKGDDLPMTVELFVTLEDGTLSRHRVNLAGRESTVELTTPSRPRSVTLNPRHEVMIDARSVVRGDIDFDGETDGLDILRCARLVGTRYTSAGGAGLWDLDETFDPRCDQNGDLRITDDDLDRLAESFGVLRR